MIRDEFARHFVPQSIVSILEAWDPHTASTATRALPIAFDTRIEFAINSALDAISSQWAATTAAEDRNTNTGEGQDEPSGPLSAETIRGNIRVLVALLQVRPVIPNSLFAIIFQAIVTIGKVSPPSVLLAEHGPLLYNLLELSGYVPTSIANVARVTARNVARRVPPAMFSEACFDSALLAWVDHNIVSLASFSDSATRVHSDRKMALMLVDKMCRVPETAATTSPLSSPAVACGAPYVPVGLGLLESVRSIVGELDTTEKQIAEAFIGRVLRYRVAPVEQKWLSGTGDTLGSPLPEPPTMGARAARMKEFLLTSCSSRSPSSTETDTLRGEEPTVCQLDAIPFDVVLRFLQEHDLAYQNEMEAYRRALDAERQRLVVLETRLRFVKDEGEEIEREARSQSRAAIAYLTPRAGSGSSRGPSLPASAGGPKSPDADPFNRPHERVMDLLVRQCAIHDTLTEAGKHVAPTVQRLDLAKVNRATHRR